MNEVYSYDLNKLTEADWQYITKNKTIFLDYTGNEKLEFLLRFPGFLIDNKSSVTTYKEFYNKNFVGGLIDPPRGNLSFDQSYEKPLILCGIAPGFSNLDRNAPKWLLGPSSKLIHKILYCLNKYPYFTNIFKAPFTNNNSNSAKSEYLENSLKNLNLELNIIYENFWKKTKSITVLTLGKYIEYTLMPKYIKIPVEIRYINMYHPSYFLRKGIVSIEHPILKDIIRQTKEQLE